VSRKGPRRSFSRRQHARRWQGGTTDVPVHPVTTRFVDPRSFRELDLVGHVVDWVCADCGSRTTTPANWSEKPICCDWQMVDLPPTVRPA